MKPGLTELTERYYKAMRSRYPSFPESYISPPKFKDNTANSLTRCIIDFINYTGGQAERINNMGRQIDNRKTYSDTLGQSRTIGSITWVKGTGTNGTSDISATIHAKSVKIEVKIGADKQSDQQKEYQKQIEDAGGIYFIAKNFQSFYEWYNLTFINKQDGL
jgi:hypothetical protein